MLIITSDIRNEIEQNIVDIAVDIIKKGGVITYATDTCYGFSCDLTNKAAVDRLRYLKKMCPEKPVTAMFDSLDMVKEWVHLDNRALVLASKYWPGGLTLIAEKKENKMNYGCENQKGRGCRIPACLFSHKLVQGTLKPISTTSANISGLPATYSVFEIMQQFQNCELKPDLIIDSGVRERIAPSTIVDLSQNDIRVLRQGDVQIPSFLGNLNQCAKQMN